MSVPNFPLTFLPNCTATVVNAGPPGDSPTADQECQVLRPYIAFADDKIAGTALQLLHGGTLLIRFFIKTNHPIRRSPFVLQETNWTTITWDGFNSYYITDAWPWTDPNGGAPIWYCVASMDQNYAP